MLIAKYLTLTKVKSGIYSSYQRYPIVINRNKNKRWDMLNFFSELFRWIAHLENGQDIVTGFNPIRFWKIRPITSVVITLISSILMTNMNFWLWPTLGFAGNSLMPISLIGPLLTFIVVVLDFSLLFAADIWLLVTAILIILLFIFLMFSSFKFAWNKGNNMWEGWKKNRKSEEKQI